LNGYPQSQPTRFLDYDANGNLAYICYTTPSGIAAYYNYSRSVMGGTLTSIVVATNVGTVTTVGAHGLMVGQGVTVSGATLGALNATYIIATVPSTTTFTITTTGVADGTYNNVALTISGSAPLLTSPIWSINKLTYSAGNSLIGSQWALGAAGNYTSICANRATINTYK
jgi:hypothetical protein